MIASEKSADLPTIRNKSAYRDDDDDDDNGYDDGGNNGRT